MKNRAKEQSNGGRGASVCSARVSAYCWLERGHRDVGRVRGRGVVGGEEMYDPSKVGMALLQDYQTPL